MVIKFNTFQIEINTFQCVRLKKFTHFLERLWGIFIYYIEDLGTYLPKYQSQRRILILFILNLKLLTYFLTKTRVVGIFGAIIVNFTNFYYKVMKSVQINIFTRFTIEKR